MQAQALQNNDGPCYVQRLDGEGKKYQNGLKEASQDGNSFFVALGKKIVNKKAGAERFKYLVSGGTVTLGK